MFSYTTTNLPAPPPTHNHTPAHIINPPPLFSSLPPEWLPSALPGAVPPMAACARCSPVYQYLREVIIEISSVRGGFVKERRHDHIVCLDLPNLTMAHQRLLYVSKGRFFVVVVLYFHHFILHPYPTPISFVYLSSYVSFLHCICPLNLNHSLHFKCSCISIT